MEKVELQANISEYSGSHFDIGTQLGKKALEKHGLNYVDDSLDALKDTSLYQLLGMNFDLTPRYIDQVFPVVEGVIKAVHPGLLDEIRGFAQALGEDYRKFLVFTSNFGNETGCSQFFINGFHARNYDDAPESVTGDFYVLNPEGSFRSFGAEAGYVERLDGINEKGLAVSLTFGAGHPPAEYGIGAAMYTRIILDKASTVDEALEIYKKAPYVTPNNVLVSDPSGKAVIIEQSAGNYVVREAQGRLIFCANSYLASEMRDQQKIRNATTTWREKEMELRVPELKDEEEIMDFLTSDFPQGLYEPYFSWGLGTIWSVIYRPETRDVYLGIGEKAVSRKTLKLNLNDRATFNSLPLNLKTTVEDVILDPRLPKYKV